MGKLPTLVHALAVGIAFNFGVDTTPLHRLLYRVSAKTRRSASIQFCLPWIVVNTTTATKSIIRHLTGLHRRPVPTDMRSLRHGTSMRPIMNYCRHHHRRTAASIIIGMANTAPTLDTIHRM